MVSGQSFGASLLGLYRRYLGEPTSERAVYLGFTLFFGGIALGVVGLTVFLYSTGLEGSAPLFWQLREIALAAAFLGLPAFILSVVMLLPVGRRASLAAAGGATLCLLAVAGFVAVYPQSWNVRSGADYSAQGIALYAAGLAVLVGATGSALVAQYLERAHPAGPQDASDRGHAEAGAGDPGTATVTDAEVRRDIEESMADTELSWGGVRKQETKRLQITSPDEDVADGASFERDLAKTGRTAGTDDAVAGLRQLQGGRRERAEGQGTDEQLEALKELRAARAAEASADPEGVLDRVRDRLGL